MKHMLRKAAIHSKDGTRKTMATQNLVAAPAEAEHKWEFKPADENRGNARFE